MKINFTNFQVGTPEAPLARITVEVDFETDEVAKFAEEHGLDLPIREVIEFMVEGGLTVGLDLEGNFEAPDSVTEIEGKGKAHVHNQD